MAANKTYNRAPKGGLTFNGKAYRGGCFVPAAALAPAPAPAPAPTVESVLAPFGVRMNGWADRVYVNFFAEDRRMNGDRNGKLWFYADDASRLFAERGKGMRSFEFADAFDGAVVALQAAGFAVTRR